MEILKIGIIPDAHVGVVKFRKSEGFRNKITMMNDKSFEEAFDKLINQEGVDKVIQVGDLFDTPEPDVHSILEVNKVLNQYDKKIPISIIGGNHDYSQRSDIHGYHVFDTLQKDQNSLLHLYDKKLSFEILDDEKVIITYVPYKALGNNRNDTFESIFRKNDLKEYKDYTKILIFHGYIDYDDKQENPEYDMPTEITQLFDFISMGHVHYPKVLRVSRNKMVNGELVEKDVYHLTPGALIPSSKATQNTQRPSVYVYDTEQNNVKIVNLEESPYVYHYENVMNINELLSEIAESDHMGIYSIVYNGKMSDIDDRIYIKALERSVNIAIQAQDYINSDAIKKVEGFWEFIKKSYPKYEKEFREVVNE